jgi:hypothetical protein
MVVIKEAIVAPRNLWYLQNWYRELNYRSYLTNISKRFLRDLDSYVVTLRPAHSFDFQVSTCFSILLGKKLWKQVLTSKFE